jgi:phosphoribosyl-ATP pyrophosphohydrolase
MRQDLLGKALKTTVIMSPDLRPLDQLEQTILARKASPGEKSYTAQLLAGGVEKIGGKLIEEAAEVVEAAGEEGEHGREHTIREAGDLVYHLLVLLACRGVSLAEVEAELTRRFGVSGLEEKANRKT